MMHGREKSDPVVVATKPPNKAGRTGGGGGGAKGGGQGERGPAKHAPDSEPGKRGTGAGSRTASRKAKEEGTVHRAPPPHHVDLLRDASTPSSETRRREWTA